MTETRSDKLFEIAKRVDRNLPRRDDPEAFHSEKSEIVSDLRRLAREERAGT